MLFSNKATDQRRIFFIDRFSRLFKK